MKACTLQWYWSTGNSCLYDFDYVNYFKEFAKLGPSPIWGSWVMLGLVLGLDLFFVVDRKKTGKRNDASVQGLGNQMHARINTGILQTCSLRSRFTGRLGCRCLA